MSTGEDGAGQDTDTYDAVVEDLNFDPESPDVQPHPDRPGPGAHASHDDDAEDHPPGGHQGQHQRHE